MSVVFCRESQLPLLRQEPGHIPKSTIHSIAFQRPESVILSFVYHPVRVSLMDLQSLPCVVLREVCAYLSPHNVLRILPCVCISLQKAVRHMHVLQLSMKCQASDIPSVCLSKLNRHIRLLHVHHLSVDSLYTVATSLLHLVALTTTVNSAEYLNWVFPASLVELDLTISDSVMLTDPLPIQLHSIECSRLPSLQTLVVRPSAHPISLFAIRSLVQLRSFCILPRNMRSLDQEDLITTVRCMHALINLHIHHILLGKLQFWQQLTELPTPFGMLEELKLDGVIVGKVHLDLLSRVPTVTRLVSVYISDFHLCDLKSMFPLLREMQLHVYPEIYTSTQLDQGFQGCTRLQHLNVSISMNEYAITPHVIIKALEHCGELISLYLTYHSLPPFLLRSLLIHLPKLRTLNLDNNVPGQYVETLIDCERHRRSQFRSTVSQVPHTGVASPSEVSHLTTLVLDDHCYTEDDVLSVLTVVPYLTSLTFGAMELVHSLSEVFTDALPLPSLETIEVKCVYLYEPLVDVLSVLRKYPRLVLIRVPLQYKLSLSALLLLPRSPNWLLRWDAPAISPILDDDSAMYETLSLMAYEAGYQLPED